MLFRALGQLFFKTVAELLVSPSAGSRLGSISALPQFVEQPRVFDGASGPPPRMGWVLRVLPRPSLDRASRQAPEGARLLDDTRGPEEPRRRTGSRGGKRPSANGARST
jgi:hypothetical protein